METIYETLLNMSLTRPDAIQTLEKFIDQARNTVLSDTGFIRPPACERIEFHIKVIYNPATTREDYHENIRNFPLATNNIALFFEKINNDVKESFSPEKIPNGCQRIAVKIKIIYDPEKEE